jgi:hypothetical protein
MRFNLLLVRIALVTLALVMVVFPLFAIAGIGGDAASVQADQVQLNATLRATPADQFTQYEMLLPSGTTVREYVSSTGAVFAITWEGPSLPDLRQLLGRYFDQYVNAVKGGGMGARVIRQPDLVVYTGGHMRAFRGRAYAPQFQPPGVVSEELQ